LEKAVELDHVNAKRQKAGHAVPHASFSPALYRQPSLNEGEQHPEPYRITAASQQLPHLDMQARRDALAAELELDGNVSASPIENGTIPVVANATVPLHPSSLASDPHPPMRHMPMRQPSVRELEVEDDMNLDDTIEELLMGDKNR
jgi:hypothetical protein